MKKKVLFSVCLVLITLTFALQAMKVESLPDGPGNCDCPSPPGSWNVGPQCYLKGTLVNCPEGHKMKYECVFIDDDLSWCTCSMEDLDPCDPPPAY